MTPTPKKKVDELIESINEMILNGLNNDRIEEIIADAEKLKIQGKSSDSYTVRGMIAALRGDANETDRLFTAALHIGGRNPATLSNYAAALCNLGKHTASTRIIDEALALDGNNLTYIKQAIKFHLVAFDIEATRKLLKRCETLGQPIQDFKMEIEMTTNEAMLAEHNAAWQDAASRIELASGVLHKLNFNSRKRKIFPFDGILLYEFQLDADIDTIAQVESAISDAIAEMPYSPVDNFLCITCSAL
ncbi:hypothetical protein [Candidatus Nitrotoga arctica]|uniref:Tetratricopeptide repeat-containing protein n=1 Tax=Candidatus Nitrotoga arctica TaxID=453162 RepID=A0ABM8YXG2_9PROT|nr:hypothetical protein [Candidatus Nitrotoga arctica]CAG9932222.1 protein of unknown function [Candidatus Nitrotoga arctica]